MMSEEALPIPVMSDFYNATAIRLLKKYSYMWCLILELSICPIGKVWKTDYKQCNIDKNHKIKKWIIPKIINIMKVHDVWI